MRIPKKGIELERTKTNRSTCFLCMEPIESPFRLKVSSGGGRFKKNVNICADCGDDYLTKLQDDIEKLKIKLAHVPEAYTERRAVSGGEELL